MLLSCHSCQKEYVASHRAAGEPFVCSNCQHGPKREPVNTRLGLHPALERKYAYQTGEEQKKNRPPHANSPPKSERRGDLSSLPQIPGFDISYQVGRGAMGSVYRAREKKSGRLVAIKVLSNELSQRSDLVARFERETYALKSLQDKNVVQIIDAGHVDDLHYFVMEFIDGITLRTRINRGVMDLEEAVFISSGILNGLKSAHTHGIIHRDLKPENVLLAYSNSDFSTKPDRVVLVDFGLVGIGGLVFDPHPNLTRSRVTMGTVNYMAPEQHIDAKRVDYRSDLYSAGVIFFEMLTGDLPLGRYLLPVERGLLLPAHVDTVLARALARIVDQRYSSAQEFTDALESLLIDVEETQTDQEHKNLGAFGGFEQLKAQSKNYIYRLRYPALLIIAALFFGLGIKVSFGSDTSTTKTTLQPKSGRTG
jgi:serine/threonine protein kinase